ncbi:hypothetical protein GQ607_013526, partial [Colletotrichum asianum]
QSPCVQKGIPRRNSPKPLTQKQKIAPRGNRTPGSPTLLDGNGEFYH